MYNSAGKYPSRANKPERTPGAECAHVYYIRQAPLDVRFVWRGLTWGPITVEPLTTTTAWSYVEGSGKDYATLA